MVLPFALLIVPAAWALAQAPQPDTPVSIYTAGSDVTSPQLLPSTLPHTYAMGNCRANEDGAITFSLIVDAAGQPRNIYFLQPNGDDLDLIALREVIGDRFTPGARAGAPVAIAASVQITLHACLAEQKDARGKTQDVLQLVSAPVQEIKPPVDPPKQAVLVSGTGVSNNPSDPISDVKKLEPGIAKPVAFPPSNFALSQGRILLGPGRYKVSIVVDRYGLPERLKILDAELPGREQQIAAFFRLFRWNPALKDGAPVPVRVEATNVGGAGVGR